MERHGSRVRKIIATTHNRRGKHLTLPMTKQLIFLSPYWWPMIDEEIKYHAEYECEECMLKSDIKQEESDHKKKQVNALKGDLPLDWTNPYIEYLVFRRVISDNLTKEKQKRIVNRS